jgi:MFS superfamily sulfate permease-like transporter
MVQFIVSSSTGVLFRLRLYLLIAHGQPTLAVTAAVAWLAGAVLFGFGVIRLAFAATGLQPPHPEAPHVDR